MSRRRRRVVQTNTPAAPQRKPSVLAPVLAAVILAGVPFVLGKYMELNSPDPFDSGAYVYSAWHILQGARLGVDEAASAQPGTLMVNLIGVALFGFNETGPKIIQGLLQAGALMLMFYTLRRLYGNLAAVVSTTIAAVYLSAPLIAKYGNVKEQHMIAFMIVAACCFLLYQQSGRWWLAVCAGAAAVNVCYFKQTGASVIIAIGLYMLLQPLMKRSPWRNTACDLMLLISGAIIGLVPLAALHVQQGQSAAFLRTAPICGIWLAIALLGVGFAGVAVVGLWRRYRVWQHLRQVRRPFWIAGAAAVLIVFLPFAVAFLCTGDLLSYLRDIPFLKVIVWARLQLYVLEGRMIQVWRGYVGQGWAETSFSRVAPQILRYYSALALPIVFASLAIILAFSRAIWRRLSKTPAPDTDRIVLLLAIWWILDMAFVWISPRSYEQYYLPLNASAAMLAAFAVGLFARGVANAQNKIPWVIGAAVGACVMLAMVWPIFAGQTHSPDTGLDYGRRMRGYAQRLKEAGDRRKGHLYPWETLGDYIRQNSTEDDRIYVWGWYPGIYVRAQRLSSSPNAFESEMHVVSPQGLRYKVQQLLDSFSRRPPRFIVDSRKRHFPNDRWPLELWPQMPPDSKRFIPLDQKTIAAHDQAWARMLAERYGGPAEAQRYQAMAPFREYVMNNYSIVGMYGTHVLFVRKTASGS
jgi:hypothetical protein